MSRIVVHSGLAKTGTSALQKWFHAHQSELSDHGVWYPNHGVASNGVSAGNLGRVGGRNARQEVVDQTLREFEGRPEETLLLSSEFFGPQIGALSTMFPADTTFVLYVRDPLEVFESGYNQRVKRAGLAQEFQVQHEKLEDLKARPEFNGGWPGHVHLSRAVENIDSSAQLDVRPYHAALFEGGDIVTDFLSSVGFDIDPAASTEEAPGTVVNPSYTLHAMEYKRAANHFDLGDLARMLDSALQSCPLGPAKYTLMSEEDYSRLRRSADGYLAALRDDLGLTSLEPLRAELEDQPQTKSYVPQRISDEDILAVGSYLRSASPDLWNELAHLVLENPDVDVPYSAFRKQFHSV